jgi:ribosomal-protein-alanine N-acetyltransferase
MRLVLLAGPYRLRPWESKDIEVLSQIADDFEVARYMSRRFPHPYMRAHAESWIALASGDATKFAIEVDGELAGGIGDSGGAESPRFV